MIEINNLGLSMPESPLALNQKAANAPAQLKQLVMYDDFDYDDDDSDDYEDTNDDILWEEDPEEEKEDEKKDFDPSNDEDTNGY